MTESILPSTERVKDLQDGHDREDLGTNLDDLRIICEQQRHVIPQTCVEDEIQNAQQERNDKGL